MTPQQILDSKIDEWNKLKAWLTTAKEREMQLRNEIAAMMFEKQANGFFEEGTSNKLVAGEAFNWSGNLKAPVKREILEELLIPTLTEAQLTPTESKGLILGKPTLGLAAYKLLPEEKQKIINKMLILKPGAITLEVTPVPK